MMHLMIAVYWDQWIEHTPWGKLLVAIIVVWLLADIAIFSHLRRFKKIKADLDKFNQSDTTPVDAQPVSKVPPQLESGIRARNNVKPR